MLFSFTVFVCWPGCTRLHPPKSLHFRTADLELLVTQHFVVGFAPSLRLFSGTDNLVMVIILLGLHVLQTHSCQCWTCWWCGVEVWWLSRINEVTLRQARLVLGWVTVYRHVKHLGMKPAS